MERLWESRPDGATYARSRDSRNVTLQEPEPVAAALKCADGGMDFADALHLAAAADCEAFVTFDQKMAKASEGLDAPAIREH